MWAYPLAALASAGVVVSLWLPWYSFTVPAQALDRAEALSSQFGILGPLVRQGAEVLRHLGPVHLTAWQALKQVDVGLALVGGVAAALALLVLAGRAAGVARVLAWAGALALALAAYRTWFAPGPSGVLHATWGAYLANVCAATLLLAGLVARSAENRDAESPALASPVPSVAGDPSIGWSTARSVAPPGS